MDILYLHFRTHVYLILLMGFKCIMHPVNESLSNTKKLGTSAPIREIIIHIIIMLGAILSCLFVAAILMMRTQVNSEPNGIK